MRTKSDQVSHLWVGFTLLISLWIAIPTGCSKDDGPDSTDPEINQYLLSLPLWHDFSPFFLKHDTVLNTTQSLKCGELPMIKTTKSCSLTRTPEDIVTFDPNSEILYLGSLIQGKGFVKGLASMKSLPIYQRAPLRISISFQMSNNSREVPNPTLTSVNQAVGELIERAQNSGHVAGTSIFFDQKSSYSLQQTALELGLSADYMVASARANLQWQSTSETNTISAYFIQKMFTVSMELPQRPADLFSNAFTQEILNEQINMGRVGPDNLPVYVSNIVYGRMMTLTMTSTHDETTMKAALEASYKGIDGHIEIEHLNVLSESSIRLVTIGGDAQSALNFLRTGQLGEFFRHNAPLTTAVPISYTLRNLRDNDIAKVSQTVGYDIEQYEPAEVVFTKVEGNWKNLVQQQMQYGEWLTTRPNVWLANESATFSQHPTNAQIWMGKRITFSPSVTGLPFDFYLENKDPALYWGHPQIHLGLVFEDKEGNSYGWPNSISIGDINDFENDNFEVGVTGNQVYAWGTRMVDNDSFKDEFLEVHAVDGDGECQIAYFTAAQVSNFTNGFMGIVSPVPIRRIYFDEDPGGDDIAIRHFYFGYKNE